MLEALSHSFMQHALLALVLSAIVSGVTGVLVVVRRITLISGAIAHAALGGVGLFYLLDWPPIYGAFIAAVSAALLIGWVKMSTSQHEDTVISAVWAAGMALGLIFMHLKPGYGPDLMTYLFGNVLLVTSGKLMLLAILSAVVILTVGLLYRQILAVCFDEEYAVVLGLRGKALYMLVLTLTALSIVVLTQVVGLILVIAMLTFPAAIAGMFANTPAGMIGAATVLGLLFNLLGLAVSWTGELPPGATIVLVSGLAYLAAFQLKKIISRNQHNFPR